MKSFLDIFFCTTDLLGSQSHLDHTSLWGSDTNSAIYKQSLLTQPPTHKPFVWDHTADMLCQWALKHTHRSTGSR